MERNKAYEAFLTVYHGLILFVAHLLHPLDDLAVELFLNRDMGHGRSRRGTMPVLFLGRAPHHVARSYCHFWTAFALHPATPVRDDQGLPERMDVPGCPSAGREGDADGEHARRIRRLGQWVNGYGPGTSRCDEIPCPIPLTH